MALSIHKKGQGSAARGLSGVAAVLMGVWAASAAHAWMYRFESPTAQIIGAAIGGGIFGLLPLYLVLFHRQVVDILIETQQEMRKVAWSSRQEVTGSTIVVLCTVGLLSMFILLMDFVINLFFRLIGLF